MRAKQFEVDINLVAADRSEDGVGGNQIYSYPDPNRMFSLRDPIPSDIVQDMRLHCTLQFTINRTDIIEAVCLGRAQTGQVSPANNASLTGRCRPKA